MRTRCDNYTMKSYNYNDDKSYSTRVTKTTTTCGDEDYKMIYDC